MPVGWYPVDHTSPLRNIAKENISAPTVAGRVFAPTRHGDIVPTAVAGSDSGHHGRVAPVGQKMRPRCMRNAQSCSAAELRA